MATQNSACLKKLNVMQKQKKFQIDIEDPYMLHSELQFPGLVVLEIFAHWCDVCKSIDPIFRNHFVDLATRKLKFVRVQHAFVPWLRRYHGRCRPTFLFFVGGSLKEIVEGIDTPRLDALIPQLAPEDEVPLEKFVPEDCFPELNGDEIYQQYTARYEELERERAIAIEAGTEADVDPRGEYNSLVKEFEQKFQLPMAAYSSGSSNNKDVPQSSAKRSAERVSLEKSEPSAQQPTEQQEPNAPSDAAVGDITQPAPVELDDRPIEPPPNAEEAADTAGNNATAEEEQPRQPSDTSEERLCTPESKHSTDGGHNESNNIEDSEGHGDSKHLSQEAPEDGQENSEGAYHYETGAGKEAEEDQEQGSDNNRSNGHSAEPGIDVDQLETEQEQGNTVLVEPDPAVEHSPEKEGPPEPEQDVVSEVDNAPEEAPENEPANDVEEPVRNIESAGTNGTTDVLDFAYTPEHVDGDIVDLLEAEEANQSQ